ncbi:hypothetical protein BFW01_g10329 [Lasiodiplodia theobromae]|uniref:Xylanolytic transcriptional activator regulatory domain-containing protein n=2 Tax=Lasiodiplodia theobromae TaxID=45133 RepID=A0A8H7IP93_9PEZI|nr:hypothetical protein BFW01_g10329 [Lasiodiplodia theobromae]
MDAGADNSTPSGTRRKRHDDSTESRKRVARASANPCKNAPAVILAHGVLDFAVPVATKTPDSVLKLPLPTTGSISVARSTTGSDYRRDLQGFFDADRIRLLEQIVEHSTGTVCFEKARLAHLLASLRPAAHDYGPRATSEDEDFTINPVSPTSALYSGELSHSNFSLRLQQRVERRLNEAVPELQGRPDAPADSPSAIKLRSQASVVIDAVSSFPPAEVAAFLADVFFKFAQTNYSYVDEQTLRQKLGRFYSLSPEIDINDAPWVCTILMIFAIGTQFAHLSSSAEDGTDHGADDILALEFYHKASGLISDVIAVASIESVQAFLLLGVYTLPIDAAGLSCTYLGIAIKIATQNGMHRKHHKTLASRQVELRRRLWWTAYTLERYT